MNAMTKLSLAAAAAALFSTAVVPTVQAGDSGSTSVKCSGINSCKGTSKCATADSACAGQNSCKGHGWITSPSAEECEAAGGTVL
jgi:hypothetical protein